MTDYWHDCIHEALDEAGIVATTDQIELIAQHAEGAHENYSQAFGYDVAHERGQIAALERDLKNERDKITCQECTPPGSGQYVVGGVRTSISTCSKCAGTGRHA